MRFSARSEERTEVNLTPLIDVVFLLLIFFMVTTTFNQQARLRVELPEASETVVESDRDHLEIIIDRSGAYFIDEKKLLDNRASTIVAALQKLMSEAPADTTLIIRADANTPHQSVVTAMDAAARAGLIKVSIATSNADQ